MFVPGKPFHPSLIFAIRAGVYPSEAPVRCSTLRKAREALPTNIRLGSNCLPGQTLKRISNINKLQA
jgi:hypothetical protein